MRSEPSKTSQLILSVLIIIAFIFFWFIFRNLYYSLWDALDARTGHKLVLSPFPWIVIGVICVWLSRFLWRQYLVLQKEEPSTLNRLQSSRAAFALGVGLAALLIGLVMLVYR